MPAVPSPDIAAAHRPSVAVVGAGPVGLSLALMLAERCPEVAVTVFDALPQGHDVSADARTLALSLGSVQTLSRMGLWEGEAGAASMAARSQAIVAVHVSQQQPALLGLLAPGLRAPSVQDEPAVCISAQDLQVAQLGAVLPYGQLVAPLRERWLALCHRAPDRCMAQFGTRVAHIEPRALNPGPQPALDRWGAHVRWADQSACFDVAVVAEGGVFAQQDRQDIHHDYRQTAWVGTVELEGAVPGMAFERFTPQGPAALLPLPPAEGRQRASLVWCVNADDDPVAPLTPEQRLAVLRTIFPPEAGRWVSVSPLKSFALGLNAQAKLVEGRAVRIGNAAQTLHPVAGQGMNLGLRDAHTLVHCLAAHPVGAWQRALREFSAQRSPDRWMMVGATDFLARSFTWDLPGLSTVRGMALAGTQRVGPWRRALARRMMGVV